MKLADSATGQERGQELEKYNRIIKDRCGVIFISPESLYKMVDDLIESKSIGLVVWDELSEIASRVLGETLSNPKEYRCLPQLCQATKRVIAACADWRDGYRCHYFLKWLLTPDPELGNSASTSEPWSVELFNVSKPAPHQANWQKLFFFTDKENTPESRNEASFWKLLNIFLAFYKSGDPYVALFTHEKENVFKGVKIAYELSVPYRYYHGALSPLFLSELREPARYWNTVAAIFATTKVGHGSNPRGDRLRIRFSTIGTRGPSPRVLCQSAARSARVIPAECDVELVLVSDSKYPNEKEMNEALSNTVTREELLDEANYSASLESLMALRVRQREVRGRMQNQVMSTIVKQKSTYMRPTFKKPGIEIATDMELRLRAFTVAESRRQAQGLLREVVRSALVHGYGVDQFIAQNRVDSFLHSLEKAREFHIRVPMPLTLKPIETTVESLTIAFNYMKELDVPLASWRSTLKAACENMNGTQLTLSLQDLQQTLGIINEREWPQMNLNSVLHLHQHRSILLAYAYSKVVSPCQVKLLTTWAESAPHLMPVFGRDMVKVYKTMKVMEEFRTLVLQEDTPEALCGAPGFEPVPMGLVNARFVDICDGEKTGELDPITHANAEKELQELYRRIVPNASAKGVLKLILKIVGLIGFKLKKVERVLTVEDEAEEGRVSNLLVEQCMDDHLPFERAQVRSRLEEVQGISSEPLPPTNDDAEVEDEEGGLGKRVRGIKAIHIVPNIKTLAMVDHVLCVSPYSIKISTTHTDWVDAHERFKLNMDNFEEEMVDDDEEEQEDPALVDLRPVKNSYKAVHAPTFAWNLSTFPSRDAQRPVVCNEILNIENLNACLQDASMRLRDCIDEKEKTKLSKNLRMLKSLEAKVKTLSGPIRFRNVEYRRKSIVGRRFAKGCSQVCLNKMYRTRMGLGTTRSVDFDNCHVRIAICAPLRLDSSLSYKPETEFPFFWRLIHDKDGVRQEVANHFRFYEKSIKNAKKLILVCLYQGDPYFNARKQNATNINPCDFIDGFRAECIKLRDMWLGLSIWKTMVNEEGNSLINILFSYAKQHKPAHKVMQTVFSYLVSSVEDSALSTAICNFEDLGWHTSLRIFDAITVYHDDPKIMRNDSEFKAVCERINEAVNEHLGFELPMNEEGMFVA